MAWSSEEFADIMFKPWTCCRCKGTFHPIPDDPQSMPVGVQIEDVWQVDGGYERMEVGELCAGCMGVAAGEELPVDDGVRDGRHPVG